MKRLEDYTEKELAQLSEKDVNRLIDIECMADGVPLSTLPMPKMIDVPEVQNPDVKIFKILGITLTDKAEAEALAKLVKDSKSIVTVDYDYSIGSQNKYIKKSGYDPGYNDDITNITESSVYSKADYDKLRTTLDFINESRNANESAMSEYKKQMSSRNDTIKRVNGAIREAVASVGKLNYAIDTYNQYIELAGGDVEVAKNFFAKSAYADYLNDVLEAIGDTANE